MTKLYPCSKSWFPLWREAAPPGLFVILVVVGLRAGGLLEGFELTTFDWLMRQRGAEAPSHQIALVAINEQDIQAAGQYPIPNKNLADAIKILQTAEPRVLGFSLLRDLPNDTNAAELENVLGSYSNIVGTDIALNKDESLNVSSPPGIPSDRIGFVDTLVDQDEKVRRRILASRTWTGEMRYSFPLQLARLYLAEEDISLQLQSLHKPLRLGTTQITQFRPNTGGYHWADANGSQILLNFSTAQEPFSVLALSDVLNQRFDSALIRDRIVIMGMAASSLNNTFITAARSNTLHAQQTGDNTRHNQRLYGIEIDAYATEQLLQTVLQGRPSLNTLPEGLEYIWILLWGSLGISFGLALSSPWKTFSALIFASFGLVVVSYKSLLLGGWWIPLVPPLLALINAGLTTAWFDRNLRKLSEQRRLTIEQTFEAVHNGPLQTLALLSRQVQSKSASLETLASRLETLDQELRTLYELMEQQGLSFQDYIHLDDNLILNLKDQLSELLFQVFEHTLSRPFPAFQSLKACMMPNFSPLDACKLSKMQKRGLCLFLEEALCNIGKYGHHVTFIDVVCRSTRNECSIEIINNNTHQVIKKTFDGGYGTYQAIRLAKQLSGQFQRFAGPNNTLHCQLKWPRNQTILTRLSAWLIARIVR
ncbi:MAG: CHASE2 domain-containing protein [Cyanobacteria bacterium P01_G01_bin.38]